MCAIPMCAPYEALQNFIFKVPLVFGTDKKKHTITRATQIFKQTLQRLGAQDGELRSSGQQQSGKEGTSFTVALSKYVNAVEENEYNLTLLSSCKVQDELDARGKHGGKNRKK
uniref:NFACT protein C-terminal domain-containing protein n=1 Tax=Lygus hesperus TaxID=30085 RepID=A0A0A9XPL0_LYGHE